MHGTVYLADADLSFREPLAQQMKKAGFTIVGEGGNGFSALREILYTMPELIVLDTELFGDDIGDIVRTVRRSFLPGTKIILVSLPKNAASITAALGAGADNCILKPCRPEEAASLIIGLSENAAREAEKNDTPPLFRDESSDRITDFRIAHLLHTVGISGNISGYFYLCTAIRMTLDSPELLLSVTKKLYPAIASEHGTKSTRVERSIRHAIEKLWYDGQYKENFDCLGYVPTGKALKPTNSEFIALAADRIRFTKP